MGFLDDLKTRVDQAVKNTENTVAGYLNSIDSAPTVVVGQPAGGNQTAAQIAQGQFGGSRPVAGPAATPGQLQNAAAASMFSGAAMSSMLPLLLIGGALYFFSGGRRRG